MLCLVSPFGVAADLSPSARSEIESLLTRLGASSCEFYRNGSWHASLDAKAHLLKKYDYLLKRGMISSAEEFIALGATKSSISDEPYQVRCPDAVARPSALWLSEALRELREASRK